MPYTVQSVTLRRAKFTKGEAYDWARTHGYTTRKIDVTPQFYRFRQQDPERFRGGRFRTIDLGDVGHLIVVYY